MYIVVVVVGVDLNEPRFSHLSRPMDSYGLFETMEEAWSWGDDNLHHLDDDEWTVTQLIEQKGYNRSKKSRLGNSNAEWKAGDDNHLKTYHTRQTPLRLAHDRGRTEAAVRTRLSQLGLSAKRRNRVVASPRHKKIKYKIGMDVKARFEGKYYPATIKKLSEGKARIAWDAGGTDTVSFDDLRV